MYLLSRRGGGRGEKRKKGIKKEENNHADYNRPQTAGEEGKICRFHPQSTSRGRG